jgi:hypothetical protein
VCRATFGYYNPNARTVEVPAGDLNSVSAGVAATQPRVFFPGYVAGAWTAEFTCGGNATWAMEWRVAAASALMNETNAC